MTPLERAERAKQILSDEVFLSVFDDIRMSLVTKLESIPIGDVDGQHETTLSLQLLKRIKTQLERYADEISVDKHRAKQENFIARMRQTIRP